MSKHDALGKHFSEGAFGMTDLPTKIGHKLKAGIESKESYSSNRSDRRSWKRRRKTRWRAK